MNEEVNGFATFAPRAPREALGRISGRPHRARHHDERRRLVSLDAHR